MNQFNWDDHKERFWNAETGLEEEQHLLNEWLNHEEENPEKIYARYIKENYESPQELETEVWNYIQNHSASKRFTLNTRWSIAASLALLLATGGLFYTIDRKEKQDKAFAQIESALKFASEKISPEPNAEIIYQDELLIILAVN